MQYVGSHGFYATHMRNFHVVALQAFSELVHVRLKCNQWVWPKAWHWRNISPTISSYAMRIFKNKQSFIKVNESRHDYISLLLQIWTTVYAHVTQVSEENWQDLRLFCLWSVLLAGLSDLVLACNLCSRCSNCLILRVDSCLIILCKFCSRSSAVSCCLVCPYDCYLACSFCCRWSLVSHYLASWSDSHLACSLCCCWSFVFIASKDYRPGEKSDFKASPWSFSSHYLTVWISPDL